MANVDFDIKRDDYQSFIKNIISTITNPSTPFEVWNDNKYITITIRGTILIIPTDRRHQLRLYMKRDNLYVTAFTLVDSRFLLRFTGKDYDHFDRFKSEGDVKELGYNGSYSGGNIFTLSYKLFQDAVDVLIQTCLGGIPTVSEKKKIQTHIFRIIVATAEATRNRVIANSLGLSSRTNRVSNTPKRLVKLMINNWDSLSNIAFTYTALPEDSTKSKKLTSEEKDILYARNIKDDDMLEHFQGILGNPRLCKYLISVPNRHTETIRG